MPGSKPYSILYARVVAEDDIPSLPLRVRAVIKKAMKSGSWLIQLVWVGHCDTALKGIDGCVLEIIE